jgi:hypothetical protein
MIPQAFDLQQNYPNPFNPSTTIAYALPSAGTVRLELRDALGRLVAVLADGRHEAGVYAVRIDRGALASGIYTYTMRAGDYVASRRMTLVR